MTKANQAQACEHRIEMCNHILLLSVTKGSRTQTFGMKMDPDVMRGVERLLDDNERL